MIVSDQPVDFALIIGRQFQQILNHQGLPVEQKLIVGIVHDQSLKFVNQGRDPLIGIDRGQKPFAIPVGMINDVGNSFHADTFHFSAPFLSDISHSG